MALRGGVEGSQTIVKQDLEDLPAPARRYLEHAIAPTARPATTVRLRMHGEIKLKTWRRFGADETLAWGREMMWRARTTVSGLPISGFDRVGPGVGEQRWRILGLFPAMKSSGHDIARSGAGRVAGESCWLPSVLREGNVRWSAWSPGDERRVRASFSSFGERADLTLTVAPDGRLEQMAFPRWGNPDGGMFRYETFGGVMEAEGSFHGYTIPTRLRMGWYFGTDRFEREGEFIRIVIDEARYE